MEWASVWKTRDVRGRQERVCVTLERGTTLARRMRAVNAGPTVMSAGQDRTILGDPTRISSSRDTRCKLAEPA